MSDHFQQPFRSLLICPRTQISLNLIERNSGYSTLVSPFNVTTPVRALDVNLAGVPRKGIEQLIERIQVSLLIGSIDPGFSFPMRDDTFAKQKAGLMRWETKFKDFLAITTSSVFPLE